MREGIGLAIETEVVRLLDAHEVDGVSGQANEYYLHDEDIECLPAEEEVDISCQKHCQE